MRKTLFLTMTLIAVAVLSIPTFAKPGSHSKTNPKLKAEMNRMLVAIGELVTNKNGAGRYDNTLSITQGYKILESLDRLRAIDKSKSYEADFAKLDSLTQKLILAAQKDDPKTAQYSQDVYATCFQCHQTHW